MDAFIPVQRQAQPAAGADSATKRPLLAHVIPRRFESVPGPEDLVVDHKRGIAYVSSQLREGKGTRGYVNGDIFGIDLAADDPRPVSMAGALEEQIGFFHPHGLDLFVGKGGERRLFVINHCSAETHSIEIFDVENDGRKLKYVRRMSDDSVLTSPNDLASSRRPHR